MFPLHHMLPISHCSTSRGELVCVCVRAHITI